MKNLTEIFTEAFDSLMTVLFYQVVFVSNRPSLSVFQSPVSGVIVSYHVLPEDNFPSLRSKDSSPWLPGFTLPSGYPLIPSSLLISTTSERSVSPPPSRINLR